MGITIIMALCNNPSVERDQDDIQKMNQVNQMMELTKIEINVDT